MIKGWRNDPRWVEFYKKRDEELAQRAMQRIKVEWELAQAHARVERNMEILRRPMKQAWESW